MMERETGGRIKTSESSFRKSANVLLPFLIYFVVHDLAQVLLIFLVNMSIAAWGSTYGEMMAENRATVNGLLNALSLAIGMAAVWPMARRELKWAKIWMRDSCLSGIHKLDRCKKPCGDGEAESNKERNNGKGNNKKSNDEKSNDRGEGCQDWSIGKKVREYALLIVIAVSVALGVNILFVLLGITGASESYQEVAKRQYGVAFGMGLLIYGVISPLAEEIVFRGLIYNRMRRYFGRWISVIACGAMFGIYHGNPVQGIYGCILGIAITWSYERYCSFLAPVLFHAAANGAVFTVGYDGIAKGNIVTPLNCAVLFGIAILGFAAVWRMKNKVF